MIRRQVGQRDKAAGIFHFPQRQGELELDADFGVGHHGQQRRRHFGQQAFRKPHGVLADARMRILQRAPHFLGLQRSQPLECPQSVQASQRVLRFRHLSKRRNRRAILLLEEQPLRGLPMPAIGMSQRPHQFIDRRGAQV